MATRKTNQKRPSNKEDDAKKNVGRNLSEIRKEISGRPIPWKYLTDSEKRSALLNPKDTYFKDQIRYGIDDVGRKIKSTNIGKKAISASKKVSKKIDDAKSKYFFDINAKANGGKLTKRKSVKAKEAKTFKCGGKITRKKK